MKSTVDGRVAGRKQMTTYDASLHAFDFTPKPPGLPKAAFALRLSLSWFLLSEAFLDCDLRDSLMAQRCSKKLGAILRGLT